jgi:hypothetical protein
MRLKIKVITETEALKEPFTIEFNKGSKLLGFHSDEYQDNILVYFENDITEEKELRTFQFYRDGDKIPNPGELRYLGTTNSSSRYLFELLRSDKVIPIPTTS